jgi:hypothetical protein
MRNKAVTPPDSSFSLRLNDGTLMLVGTAILLSAAVTWAGQGPNVEKTDFSLTYVGAKIIHDGMGSDLYNIRLQQRLRDQLFAHPVPLFFEHPPFEAALLAPLAGLPFRSAYLIWGIANALMWLAVMVGLRSSLPWPKDNAAYTFLWVLFAPLWVTLYQGQSSLLVLLAFALSFVLLRHNREFAGGLALGLGLVKFQFVLPFVLIQMILRKWRFVIGFSVSVLILALVALVGVGWRGIASYARFLGIIANNPQNVSYGSGLDMPTIHGFVYALLHRAMTGVEVNVFAALLSVSLLTWIAMRWRTLDGSHQFSPMFAAAIATSLLSGGHMFTHDFSPLILAIFLVSSKVSHRNLTEVGALTAISFRVALIIFWSFPLYVLFVKWHCLFLLAPVLLLFVFASVRIAIMQPTGTFLAQQS